MVQDFVVTSRSKCNIEKSKLLCISKDNNFDPCAWLGEVVLKGVIVRHLGASIGVDIAYK